MKIGKRKRNLHEEETTNQYLPLETIQNHSEKKTGDRTTFLHILHTIIIRKTVIGSHAKMKKSENSTHISIKLGFVRVIFTKTKMKRSITVQFLSSERRATTHSTNDKI